MPKILVAFIAATVAAPAAAYLDPGTGSVLLQSLVGVIAIAAAAIGTFFGRIRAFLSSRGRRPDAAAARSARPRDERT